MNPPATLVEEAKNEADQVERELAEAAKNDVSLVDRADAAAAEGAAAARGEDEPAEYSPPDPTDDEIQRGLKVLADLRARVNDFGAEQTIEALVAIVDVVPGLRRPEEWPGEEDEEYFRAPEIELICNLLLKGCRSKLTLSPADVVYLWRNKAKWTQNGVTVRSSTKALDTRTQFLTEGTLVVVEMNFHHWKQLNPLQKIFSCYRALRVMDGDASVRHSDFQGYFDELELFGPRVFKEMARLKAAIEAGSDRDLPFQISLFEQTGDED